MRRGQRYRPCFVAYDVIYLNDQCLTEKPYVERARLLRTLLKEEIGVFQYCERIKVHDNDHIVECMNKAFDADEEGVVIKQAESTYLPGKREKGGWFKIKPDVSDRNVLFLISTDPFLPVCSRVGHRL